MSPVERFIHSLDVSHPCPASKGAGVHQWIYGRACWGRELGLDPTTVAELIRSRMTRPESDPGEVARSVADAYARGGSSARQTADYPLSGAHHVYPPKEDCSYNEEALRMYTIGCPNYVNEDWLQSVSPIPPSRVTPLVFLRHLYQDDESVVLIDHPVAKKPSLIATMRPGGLIESRPFRPPIADKWLSVKRHPLGVWFLAQPVDGLRHEFSNAEGQADYSYRNHLAVTSWRWLVLESDCAPPDLWLKFLACTRLPVAAIYSSGGRGHHGLVRVDAMSKEHWDQRILPRRDAYARVGVDTKIWSAVRLTRLPGCWREEKGRRQELIYLDPSTRPGSVPIIERHPRPLNHDDQRYCIAHP